MGYGLATYVNGVDVILTTKPYNPVLSVVFENMGEQDFILNIPQGVGELLFTNSIDRPQVDHSFFGGGLSTPTEVLISGTVVTIKFRSVGAGVEKHFFTFYRLRS